MTVADIGRADMGKSLALADYGWLNGVWAANSNLVIRYLGILMVTIPMGLINDIGMPLGLTFAARPCTSGFW